jgi:hypothetical protein
MDGRTNSDRDQVLNAVLALWADVLDGVAGNLARTELFTSVAGHLLDRSGVLCRADVLRNLLRQWLRPRSGQSSDELQAFLVSWGLTTGANAEAAWRRAGSPRRADPAPHVAAAVGCPEPRPVAAQAVVYAYLPAGELHPGPGGAAAGLVDAAVEALGPTTTAWGTARENRFRSDVRSFLTPHAADTIHLFESSPVATDPALTIEVTRLAFITAVGVALARMSRLLLNPLVTDDVPVRQLAAGLVPRWTTPPELAEFQRACESAAEAANSKGERDLADLRTALETFAANVRSLPPRVVPEMRVGPDEATTQRRLSILVELAIADVRGSHNVQLRVIDKFVDLIRTATDLVSKAGANAEMLAFQRKLSEPVPRQEHRRAETSTTLTFLHSVLTDRASGRLRGQPPPIRPDGPAGLKEVGRLVDAARSYLTGGRERPEQILRKLADDMPSVVAALVAGPDLAKLGYGPDRARWWLFEAAGDALHKRPELYESVIVGGAFADLGWVVANERAPEQVRDVTEVVQEKLRAVRDERRERDLWGVLTRIMRGRPLAESKSANFARAQLMADQSVWFGSRTLDSAIHTPGTTATQIVAALTGLQLSLLQASGVYIRSAETEIIVPPKLPNKEERLKHRQYIRVLTATSCLYIDLAVARLKDLDRVMDAGLLSSAEVNLPNTAPASTAMMGMRTILLSATLELAFPGGRTDGRRALVPSVPQQFCEMLGLRHLTRLNFDDMTRLAMHYAFLTGDFTHPARNCRGFNPQTPPHLRPGQAGLDLDACGRYLEANNVDTGILDVIHLASIRRVFDEATSGRYGEWLAAYTNPKKRTAVRDVNLDPVRLRDLIVGR